MASSLVRCCTQLALAMMVLVQLLEVAQGAKRNSRRDDESDDTPMEMAWAGLKLTFAFSPFIGLFFFMFCSAFESKEKERLKRAKKHGALHWHSPSAHWMSQTPCVSSQRPT